MTGLPPLNHIGGIISGAHREIRDSVHKLHAKMLRFESQIPAGMFNPGPVTSEALPFLETKYQSKMYSRVVQVFALLAVEAFLNEYGYLRLGEEVFERKFKSKPVPISRKLKWILREVAADFGDVSQIERILKSLADRRNKIVHPKPQMIVLLDDGTIRKTTKRLPRLDPAPATTAVEEMERFFELFAEFDPESAHVLRCMPRRPSDSGDGQD